MAPSTYVHGYSDDETGRLGDQAGVLADLLHADTGFAAGSRVLEVGCGVGAQTVHLRESSPGAVITSVDISLDSVMRARDRIRGRFPHAAQAFCAANLFDLPFADDSFHHLFVCFVLEHLPEPVSALRRLRRVLRPGGSITVIEGDHGSAFFHPDSTHARAAIACQIQLQSDGGGDALIGRRLHPLLAAAGYSTIVVRPRTVYADESRPAIVDGFTRKTFTAMIEAVRDDALVEGLTTPADWDRGIADLYRTAAPGGTFSYTFFKASAAG